MVIDGMAGIYGYFNNHIGLLLDNNVGWGRVLFEYLVKLSPKPSDLAMDSLKLLEMEVEERTGDCGKNLGRSVARGKKPIELGNSWFSAKIM